MSILHAMSRSTLQARHEVHERERQHPLGGLPFGGDRAGGYSVGQQGVYQLEGHAAQCPQAAWAVVHFMSNYTAEALPIIWLSAFHSLAWVVQWSRHLTD